MIIIILAIVYILNIIDYLFTSHWISKYGIEVELNPIAAWMFQHNLGGIFKIFVTAALLVMFYFCIQKAPKYRWTVYIIFSLYALLDIYHVILYICNF